ncbi:hypothetical protein [Pontibacter sp. G13]|uniref:hypothetical protein n=1 Tax=Pontibacter sp. G13 TaxID=3074898 RepID=UPI002889579D|nr:hypothetical protein [Pontibacter sp. G13]WNJ18473.1 hypothetical protein RJD25_26760 [Pontibacter sp. G13]
MVRAFLSIFFLSFLLSCQPSDSQQADTTDSIPEIQQPGIGFERPKAQVLDHIFSVDELDCELMQLAATQFSVEYPDSVEMESPKNGRDYVIFRQRSGQKILEEISIGATDFNLANGPGYATQLLQIIKDELSMAMPEAQFELVGQVKFQDRKGYLLTGEMDFRPFQDPHYPGKYRMLTWITLPTQDQLLHSVVITCLAHEEVGLQDWKGFETQGIFHKILPTFQYIERMGTQLP